MCWFWNWTILATAKVRACTGFLNGLTFSADGRVLIAGGHDGVSISGVCPPLLAWENYGDIGVTLSKKTVVWRMPDGTPSAIYTKGLPRARVKSPFLLTASFLAFGRANGGVDVVNASDGSLVYSLCPHGGGTLAVSFSPDGQLGAWGTNMGTIAIWQTSGGEAVSVLHVCSMLADNVFFPS